MSQDERAYYTFYGIHVDDWGMDFPGFSNYHKLLVKNFISEDASTTSSSAWSNSGIKFIFPHHIKKKFFLEGVVEGHITFTNDPLMSKSFVSDYKVSIIKIDTSAEETTLAATSVVSVLDTYEYDTTSTYIVYPFWIDVWSEAKEIGENERIGVKIQWNVDNTSSTTAYLSHENWQQGEDIKITLPFLL